MIKNLAKDKLISPKLLVSKFLANIILGQRLYDKYRRFPRTKITSVNSKTYLLNVLRHPKTSPLSR